MIRFGHIPTRDKLTILSLISLVQATYILNYLSIASQSPGKVSTVQFKAYQNLAVQVHQTRMCINYVCTGALRSPTTRRPTSLETTASSTHSVNHTSTYSKREYRAMKGQNVKPIENLHTVGCISTAKRQSG